MFDIEKILSSPPPPPRPLLPGNHGVIAERFPSEALRQVAMFQIYGELFDQLIRQQPDNDEQLDFWMGQVIPSLNELRTQIEAFRQTRTLSSEN